MDGAMRHKIREADFKRRENRCTNNRGANLASLRSSSPSKGRGEDGGLASCIVLISKV